MTIVLTVYDSKAEAFLTPMFAPTRAYAVRMFAEAANNPTHDFCKFSADFTLFEIGDWDEKEGTITPYNGMENLGTALHHKKEIS